MFSFNIPLFNATHTLGVILRYLIRASFHGIQPVLSNLQGCQRSCSCWTSTGGTTPCVQKLKSLDPPQVEKNFSNGPNIKMDTVLGVRWTNKGGCTWSTYTSGTRSRGWRTSRWKWPAVSAASLRCTPNQARLHTPTTTSQASPKTTTVK